MTNPRQGFLKCIKNCSVRWFICKLFSMLSIFMAPLTIFLFPKYKKKKKVKNTLAITECQAIKTNDFLCIDLKEIQVLDICM